MIESTKNILWINYLKAICIILVYFVHSTNYYGFYIGTLNLYIKPIYVNGFFFVSGYLFFKKQLSSSLIMCKCKKYLSDGGKTFLSNIVYRIVIPSTLFAAIEFVPSFMLRDKEISLGQFLYKTVGGCTYWFTSALVVAELFLFIMLLFRKRNILFYVLFSCFITMGGHWIINNNLVISSEYPLLPWCYKSGMLAISFLALGGLYWKIECYIDKLMNKWNLFGLIFLYVLFLTLYPNNFQVLISMHQLNLSGVIVSLIGIMILIYLLKWFPYENNILNYIGKNSIGFYFMSGALPIVLSMVLNYISLVNNLGGLFVVFIVSIIVAYFAVLFIKRYLPYLFDLRTLYNYE